MRTRPLLVLAVAALAVALTACVPEPEPVATSTVTPTPTPTPTFTGTLVAPGAQPPAAFGGDCAAVLTPAQLADVLEVDMTLDSSATDAPIAAAGGLTCTWIGTDAALVVGVFPQAGVGDAALDAQQQKAFFEDCDPTLQCSWQWESDELWAVGTLQFIAGMDRESVDGWGVELGEAIGANWATLTNSAQAPVPWMRDRTGWWPVLDCADVAAAVSDALGAEVTGTAGGYPSALAPARAIADAANHQTACRLTVPGASSPLTLFSFAGEAWHVRESEQDVEYDTQVDGVTGFRLAAYNGAIIDAFSFTDGVNRVHIDVPGDGDASVDDLARAVAAAVASGF